METINEFTAIETFSGAVGPLGVHNAGVKSLLAVDFDATVQKVFELNYKDNYEVPFLNADIFKLSAEEIMEMAGIEEKELFLFTSTSPCQGFSVAGKKDPFDYKNALFLKSQQLISKIKPKFLLMENVPGMAMPFNSPIFNEINIRFDTVLSDYNIECRKLNAIFYGANQTRERLIFIGVRKDIGIMPPYPIPDLEGANSRRIKDILPTIDGVYCGQSIKRVNLKSAFFNTITAGECFQIMDNGDLRDPTTDELKLIAGLPEWFSFEGISPNNIHKIIGNAVPVQFMETLVSTIKDAYLNFNRSH